MIRNLTRWSYLLCMWLIFAKDSAAQEVAESLFALLERIHSRNGLKFKFQDNFHQEVSGGLTLPVSQIGHVAIRDSDTGGNCFIRQSGHEVSIVQG